jgi:hypothetical protein
MRPQKARPMLIFHVSPVWRPHRTIESMLDLHVREPAPA